MTEERKKVIENKKSFVEDELRQLLEATNLDFKKIEYEYNGGEWVHIYCSDDTEPTLTVDVTSDSLIMLCVDVFRRIDRLL